MEEGSKFISCVLIWFLLITKLSLCCCLNVKGLGLLRFKEGLVKDRYGVLSSWKKWLEEEDVCLRFGFECEEKRVVSSKNAHKRSLAYRRLLQAAFPPSPMSSPSPSPSPSPSVIPPSPSISLPSPSLSPTSLASPPTQTPSPSAPFPSPSINLSPPPKVVTDSKHKSCWPTVSVAVGGSFVLLSIVGILFYRSSKVVTIKPWATGLSGQLQKAFVTGVPKLKRTELQTACEDFSNIIDLSSDGTVYKGTLSSGVEIAVASTAAIYALDWSTQLEEHFRMKIETLSRVNHKNFMNLVGLCEEEEPFTRMMVFEYAPNGTLFEHLHFKEAEHLNWSVRLRIIMGMAYCLDHMHQLSPPVIHKNFHSTTVYLSEDYAAKTSNFGFWNEAAASKMRSAGKELLHTPLPDLESNVYSFGLMLLEIITGRLPYSVEDGLLVNWASIYLAGEQLLKDMVDPTLESFEQEDLQRLCEVIKSCINVDPKQRPSMNEVTAELRDITGITSDGAIPRLSPLWWAELEILSTEAV